MLILLLLDKHIHSLKWFAALYVTDVKYSHWLFLVFRSAEELKHCLRLWLTELYCCLSYQGSFPTFPSCLFFQSESVWHIPLHEAKALAKAGGLRERYAQMHKHIHTTYILLQLVWSPGEVTTAATEDVGL